MRARTFQPQCYVPVAVLRVGYAEVVFIQPGGKLDTMWRGAWQRLATRHQGEMWPLQMVTAAGRCSLSHRQKHRNLQRENLQVTELNILSPNCLDLNTVNWSSGVLFSRRSTIIKVTPQLTKWRALLSKAWQKLPHAAVIVNSSLLLPFYLRLMLFARCRHYFTR